MRFDIIALDVDGTLLTDDHKLTARTIEAVQQAAVRGAEIVLCTGRGPSITIPLLEQMGLSGTVITHNGAATVDSARQEVVTQFSFGLEEIAPCLDYCRERGVHFDLNTAFDLYIEKHDAAADVMYREYGASPILLEQGAAYPPGLVKLCLFGSGDIMDTVENQWGQWSGGMQFIRSGDHFIDLMQKDVHKGKALEELARMRGVERSRIMAIGNYYNDVGMLRAAGLGIAMGNSPDGVKAEADAITLSNNEEGVRHALQTYLY
ncbi:Cof-type HAD-IIB family hydrolase [Paenibacillus sp. GCM10012307]|uniref:HAD family phosphatase n=1 Tax=Paenibacillus roseus TaxID=2798579 RepID=A0A934J2X6_9BACL|nr:Cof-type HAD-IIB family hydrolase [Paenibacillus roseus]MBJ6359871.1 HAD family phosphatase [Paenibacillus roseus]